ncbi:hypothetical protein SCOCK_50013 [Actinacidiphila cocklensis]|uniref:Uncharacterized protein n=1 Tax=Actinacidiphila cocklensis TaxID=887465 RepID=A0A9W4E000_9ACTN|nr:hypothetical protein SCOCK_50013 [Actinacidiphila cocklensis]
MLICGSAKMRAKRNASRPAAAPARMPRSMSFFSMSSCPIPRVPAVSVAGETEEVPGVVDELVDVHVLAEDRDGALVDTDEVVGDQREGGGAEHPQCGFGGGQDDRRGCRAGCGNAAQGEPSLGDRASLFHGRRDERLSDSPLRRLRRRVTVARPCWNSTSFPSHHYTASVGLGSVMRQSGRTDIGHAFPAGVIRLSRGARGALTSGGLNGTEQGQAIASHSQQVVCCGKRPQPLRRRTNV